MLAQLVLDFISYDILTGLVWRCWAVWAMTIQKIAGAGATYNLQLWQHPGQGAISEAKRSGVMEYSPACLSYSAGITAAIVFAFCGADFILRINWINRGFRMVCVAGQGVIIWRII